MAIGLFNMFSRKAKQSTGNYFQMGWSVPPDNNSLLWYQMYGKSPRMAVVRKIASDLAAVPGKLYLIDGRKNRRELHDHPFLQFWHAPNPLPEMSLESIWELFGVNHLIKGEAYLIKEMNGSNVAALWPVSSQWVRETPFAGSPFYRIQVPRQAGELSIPIEQMLVARDLNPLDPYGRGLGQAEALADEVEADEYAVKFQKNFFWNNATPPFIVGVKQANDDQIKRLKARWMEQHSGFQNAHSPEFLTGEMTLHTLSTSAREMDFTEFRKQVRDACNQLFGVPPEIMGIVENSNRATIDAAKLIYAENVLTPRLRARQRVVNEQLLPHFGEHLLWEYDDVVPSDRAFHLQVANDGLIRGAITVNEWRKANGFEPLPNGAGDVLMPPMSVSPVEPSRLKEMGLQDTMNMKDLDEVDE